MIHEDVSAYVDSILASMGEIPAMWGSPEAVDAHCYSMIDLYANVCKKTRLDPPAFMASTHPGIGNRYLVDFLTKKLPSKKDVYGEIVRTYVAWKKHLDALPGDTVKTLFKVRDKKTGLYSSGGHCPDWSANGKTWNTLRSVRSHISFYLSNQYPGERKRLPAKWEIVEIRTDVVQVHPIEPSKIPKRAR
ncbi:MAG: hypothetical protein BWY99_01801 [Synergistetes bacterium ADurb.BinA166]|nr:MAG: hypothetical protein BWY99_01801 [Synergistetes bacterium ADurb.BinA166]